MKKIYIAIPYSGMEESSYKQANHATALCMQKGHNPFSPITHSHPVAKDHEVPGSWEFWESIDLDWIDACDEIWVIIPHEGYERVTQSTGVQAELEYANKNDKTIKYFTIKDNMLCKEKISTT